LKRKNKNNLISSTQIDKNKKPERKKLNSILLNGNNITMIVPGYEDDI
jgi:small nuclear ribonucleoprotein (snRNP)-like protein